MTVNIDKQILSENIRGEENTGQTLPPVELPDPIIRFEKSLQQAHLLVSELPEKIDRNEESCKEQLGKLRVVNETLMHAGQEIAGVIAIDLEFSDDFHINPDFLNAFGKRLWMNYALTSYSSDHKYIKEQRLALLSQEFGMLRPYAKLRMNPESLEQLVRKVSKSLPNEEELRLKARRYLWGLGTFTVVVGLIFASVILLSRQELSYGWAGVIVGCLVLGGVLLFASGFPEYVRATLRFQHKNSI